MRIEGYTFGRVTVDGARYTRDVLLLPPRVLSPWWRREGHRLDPADLDPVVAYAPAVLVVGCGAYGAMKVPDGTRTQLEAGGIAVEILPTDRACERFNALVGEGTRVAGALHLTC